MTDSRYQRERLVKDLARGGITDARVLEAMRETPRHLFVDEHLRRQAYLDHALPLKEGQTISQPTVVAWMTQLLDVRPEHTVLEIGTGSGYQTAILARLCRVVYSIERIATLAREAIARMRELGLQNVKIFVFDGTVGYSDAAPYQRIMVTAGAPAAPPRLLEQLAPGGRLVLPEGTLQEQVLTVYEKDRRGRIRKLTGEAVSFVPLVGREGWPEGGRR